MLPFIDAREAINVTDVATGNQILPQSIVTEIKSSWTTGYNYFRNETEIREFLVTVNGNDPEIDTIKLEGL